MIIVKTKAELEDEILRSAQDDGTGSRALVPTMGALHEGHLSLVKLAKAKAEKVWVSIFVNPLQFGPNEDFDKYPRTFEEDCKKLEELGVDFVFAPTKEDLYKPEPEKLLANPELANILCGKSRPGHFDGVCTVVKLLFDLIKPKFAVFGEKDYQQLMIIKDMVSNLKIPVEIIPGPIMREANGLAMSSRNKYLSAEQKELAGNIYQALVSSQTSLPSSQTTQLSSRTNVRDLKLIQKDLEKQGFDIEYLEKSCGRLFIAVKLGPVRLIDNVPRL